MGVMAGSAGRNPAIVTGILGAIVGLLFGIGVTTIAVSAEERGAAQLALAAVRDWLSPRCSRLLSSVTRRQLARARRGTRGALAVGGSSRA